MIDKVWLPLKLHGEKFLKIRLFYLLFFARLGSQASFSDLLASVSFLLYCRETVIMGVEIEELTPGDGILSTSI